MTGTGDEMSEANTNSGPLPPDDDVAAPDRESPFTPPSAADQVGPVETDPSVFLEPWMKSSGPVYQAASEQPPALHLSGPSAEPEHSVWDEPGLSRQLSGDVPTDGMTWIRWYEAQAQQTTILQTWLVTLLVAAVSGVGAVAGVFLLQSRFTLPLVLTVVTGPVTEEILKVAVIAWVCEKRPWLFSSTTQILLCGLISGLAFAVVENLLYLNVYIPDPSADLVAWRWSVCVLLHTACSTIAALGMARVWTTFQRDSRPPRLVDGSRWILAAVILHSAYNLAATTMEFVDAGF